VRPWAGPESVGTVRTEFSRHLEKKRKDSAGGGGTASMIKRGHLDISKILKGQAALRRFKRRQKVSEDGTNGISIPR